MIELEEQLVVAKPDRETECRAGDSKKNDKSRAEARREREQLGAYG